MERDGGDMTISADPILPAAGTWSHRKKNGDPPFKQGVSTSTHQFSGVADLLAAGKALRDTLPRQEHAHWKRRNNHIDPIRILHQTDEGRLPELVPIRYGRMMQSPFAFFRGSAAVMAADLAQTATTGILVQACGDCHLANFGGFATPERNVIFDINDFDETLRAAWEWDVKRLVVSFVLAARFIGLTESQGREAAAEVSRSYRKAMRKFTEMHPLDVWYSRLSVEDVIDTVPKERRAAIKTRIEGALARSGSEMDFPRLAGMVGGQVGIRDNPPLIFHPDLARSPDFDRLLAKVFASYRETLADDRRALLDQYRVVDAAIKVVGIGSVGRRCWIALLMSATNHPLFLQFKEAVASVLEPYAGRSTYAHHGHRVVAGQRLMQPYSDMFLGWVSAQTKTGRKHYYVRQLRDAKIKPLVETFDAELLRLYGKACGRVLARAHAKPGGQAIIGGYLGSSDQFDLAITNFAVTYADQVERDYSALKAAVKSGKTVVRLE